MDLNYLRIGDGQHNDQGGKRQKYITNNDDFVKDEATISCTVKEIEGN